MFKPGKIEKISGVRYRINSRLGEGGYGEVWSATCLDDNNVYAIKRFHKHDDDDVERWEKLCEFELHQILDSAAGPIKVIYPDKRRTWAGYIMPLACGVALDQWLETREFNVLDNLLVGLQIVKIVEDAHSIGLAYGDVHPRNFVVDSVSGMSSVTAIDWDNARIEKTPLPRSPGVKPFLAPESMRAFLNGQLFPPDALTDCCSVAKCLHLLLLGRNSYQTNNEREFEAETAKGVWNSDPRHGPVDVEKLGGVSNQWISPELAALFRRAFGIRRSERPPMNDWLSCLNAVLIDGLQICPNPSCQCPMMVARRSTCPHCEQEFPRLAIRFADGRRVVVGKDPLTLGQSDLGSECVSRRHAVVARLGPELSITDLNSKNGTTFWDGKRWYPISEKSPNAFQASDRIRCANVEFDIVPA